MFFILYIAGVGVKPGEQTMYHMCHSLVSAGDALGRECPATLM